MARHQFVPLNPKTSILDAKILYVKLFLPPLASRPIVDYINTMPDKRTHRGPHPEDAKLFAVANIPTLRKALADYSMLLTKGYAEKSALKLVGDHFSLTQRQRLALMRSACSDSQLAGRQQCESSRFVEALASCDDVVVGRRLDHWPGADGVIKQIEADGDLGGDLDALATDLAIPLQGMHVPTAE